MITIETFETYVQALERHDWTYAYSDDGSVWRRGLNREQDLRSQTMVQPLLLQAYNAWYTYVWANPKTKEERIALKVTRDAVIADLRQQILTPAAA